jgi:heme A synthase
MVVAWMLIAPLGILIARYGRTMFTWFPAHRAVQLFAFFLIFIGFFLAVAGVQIDTGDHFSQTHNQLGLAMFILIIVQVALGAIAHTYKSRTGKRYIAYAHIPLGLILFGEIIPIKEQ